MSRLPDQNRLIRIQRAGMLSLVITVVVLLASYFFYQQWQDYQQSRATLQQQSRQHGLTFLRTWSEDAIITLDTLDTLHRQTQDILRQRIHEHVDQAHALATALYQTHTGSGQPDARARHEIIEALRPLRYFDGRGYFFVDTLDGDCVLLPTQPKLEGSSLLDNRDDTGAYIMRNLITATRNPQGAGFTSYRWHRPGEKKMAEKVAYARRFEPFGWLIGGGEYVSNVAADLQNQGLALLAQMRSDKRGGFIVLDGQGRVLLGLDGQQRPLPDALRQRLWHAPAGSVLDFQLPGSHGTRAYTAYVGRMTAWQWQVIAVSPASLLQADDAAQQQLLGEQTEQRVLATLAIFVTALMLAVMFSLLFARWLRQLADAYQHQIEEKQAALEQNAREIELTRYMSDSAADIIVLRDARGNIAYRNQRARECFDGCSDGSEQQLFALRLEDGECSERQIQCCHGPRTLEIRHSSVHYRGEHYLCATARDISQRLEQERALRLASKVFEASTEAILITDADSRIVAANQSFTAITGYSEAEALGQTPALLSSGKHDAAFFRDMWQQLQLRGQWSGEIWNRRKSGEIYPEWLSINALRDSHGKLSNYIALFSDISERKEAEARVQHLAEYDYLTDLPNRLLLMDRLQQSLRVAERSRHKVAVLFLDLDRFKNINDTLGHATGDTLLQEVARRTRHVVREMDTVGRTGGDEFVMILPELADNAQAALIAERVLDALRQPFQLDGHQLVITASIGISVSPDDGRDAQLLLKNADMAMYEAKAQGRNNYRFFTERMTAEVRQRLLLENRLRGALARQELHLMLQPKFWVADRRLSGFEALLRWTDDHGVSVPPAQFILVAEESGLIIDIGSWVLREACRLAAAWPQHGEDALTMAVNVSPRQLAQPDFAGLVAGILQETGLAPAQLEIEVTESALLERTGHVKAALDGLKALGVRLAVDDFGTGYSSLAYLKDFAPDTVKIDRCFVTDLQHRDDNAAIVLAIITLAKSLKMEALAEGVETEEELAALARLGCEAVQGYLTGRPLTLGAAAKLVAANTAVIL